MKKLLSSFLVSLSLVAIAGCASQGPLTEEQQAAQYGLTVERYREEKSAAARMNMSFDEHIKMIQNGADMKMDGQMKMK